MSTRQISLPGQAHVAEGPHDQTGMYVMHHAFRRDLANVEAAVRQTPLHDAATWRALDRRWAKFGEVLHHHHGVEDVAFWPVLCATPRRQETPTRSRCSERWRTSTSRSTPRWPR